MIPIQPQSILVFTVIHTIVALALLAIAWICLSHHGRLVTALALGAIWLATLIGIIDNSLGNHGFINWLLDPTADNNFGATLSTVLLMMTALACISLFWQSLFNKPGWHRFYWFILSFLFVFLALDEYYSLHEFVIFWRGGYLILGTLLGIMSLIFIRTSSQLNQRIILLFLIGFGVMGFGGIVLDAFSSQNVLDIGDLKLTIFSCHRSFLSINCRDYNFTEDMLELFGAALMAISLWSLLRVQRISKNPGQRMLGAGAVWLSLLIGWLWILPAIETRMAIDAQAEYGDFSLLAYSLSADTIKAGDTLDVTIYMRANQFLDADYSLSVHLYTQIEAQSIAQDDMSLGEFVYPTRGWLPFVPIRNRFHLDIPDDLATNQSYQLVMILWQGNPDNVIQLVSTPLKTLSEGSILVLDGIAAPVLETVPAPSLPVYQFESGIYLAGYQLPESVQAGDRIQLDFWWRTDKAQNLALSQFLHWFHVEIGEYFIFDQIAFAGRFPMQDWPAELFAKDSWEIALPENMPAGEYQLQTGLFRLDNQERLAVSTTQDEAVLNNSIILGQVMVNE